MERIPCIKCTLELWEYIKPYLEEWGYSIDDIDSFYKSPLLCINRYGLFGNCTNFSMECIKAYDRELVTDVEEFLERAAKLKGFAYKRKDIMEINGIEINPGMGICIDSKYDNNKFYIVIPTKLGLAVINYGQSCHWLHLDSFLSQYKNRIVAICGLATQNSIRGDFLWVAPEEIVLTMDDIAKKFGYPVEQIKIASSMAWLAVDKSGDEFIFQFHPRKTETQYLPLYPHSMWLVLPKGSIKKLTGKELTWDDEPVEI